MPTSSQGVGGGQEYVKTPVKVLTNIKKEAWERITRYCSAWPWKNYSGFSDNLQKKSRGVGGRTGGLWWPLALLQPGVQGRGLWKPWVWQCSGWFLPTTTHHRLPWRHSDCEVIESLSDSWKADPWLAFSSSMNSKISRLSPWAVDSYLTSHPHLQVLASAQHIPGTQWIWLNVWKNEWHSQMDYQIG